MTGSGATPPMVCANCLRVYEAGHVCGFERQDWNRARKAEHRCACDTCYRGHLEGRVA